MQTYLRSKIRNLVVTDVNVSYDGSISLDPELMEMAGISPFEQVHVLNVTNGERFITYAIKGEKDEVCVNGAASHLVEFNDVLMVLTYEIVDHGVVRHYANHPTIVDAEARHKYLI